MAFLWSRNSKAFSAAASAGVEDAASALCGHALAKAVSFTPALLARLICALHIGPLKVAYI